MAYDDECVAKILPRLAADGEVLRTGTAPRRMSEYFLQTDEPGCS